VCEWCGRAFLLRDQPRPGRWRWAAVAALCALAAVLIAGVALLNALGLWQRAGSSSPGLAAPSVPSPEPTPATAVPFEEPVEPTPQATQYVRVGNTAGQGVILRREPSTSAARVGVRGENSVLQIVGPDETVDGRVWRQVQDAQGNRGWVPAEFLLPAPPPGT
jgi:Bacterial SH3 domain